jgi:hypothetical protein
MRLRFEIARNAGITAPEILNNAILDFAITDGAPGFIRGYVEQQRELAPPGASFILTGSDVDDILGGTGVGVWLGKLSFSANSLQIRSDREFPHHLVINFLSFSNTQP